jgi:hypothetical protein
MSGEFERCMTWCRNCKRRTRHVRPWSPKHRTALASLIWAIVHSWLDPWRCIECVDRRDDKLDPIDATGGTSGRLDDST